jgi:hypothetical protein
MKKPEPQGFEVTEYDGDDSKDIFSGIAQISSDMPKDVPTSSVRFAQEGHHLKVVYQTYEMHLPRKIAQVREQSRTSIKEAVSYLKKEFTKRYGKRLKIKEIKDSSNYMIQKVSMNERYMYVAWCLYETDK